MKRVPSLLGIVIAALFLLALSYAVFSPNIAYAGFCQYNGGSVNCNRDDVSTSPAGAPTCGDMGGFCRNRMCICGEADPGICPSTNRCDSRGLEYSAPPGVSTVHITTCRGANSGAKGGVISYCFTKAATPTPVPTATPTPTSSPSPSKTPTPTPKPSISVTPRPSLTPTPTPTPPNNLPGGTIVGSCIGWPTPHVEIRWSADVPPGSLPANSNSVLRSVDGTADQWFFAGAAPGVYGTRISGSVAQPWGAGGYPNPNYTVYDLRDNLVVANGTYTYKVKYRPESASNTYSVAVNATNCGATPPATTCPPGTTQVGMTNSIPPNPICSSTVADGRIDGYCAMDNTGAPSVHLMWSQNPPPNQGAASMNVVQKGDCFVNDPNKYWCDLANLPTQYSFVDADVQVNTQYQYRVRYRADLASLNTYNIFTSGANCGVLPPSPGPLTLAPSYQTAPPNVTAFVTATGGDGSYVWSAPSGTITGSGPAVGIVYTNSLTTAVSNTVTVYSGGQSATATVQVDGVQTYRDDIDLTGRGSRYILINDDAPIASSSDVTLTLAHGFSNLATSSIMMKLGNTSTVAAAAAEQPFQKHNPWNICTGLSACGDGMYTVYAIYRAPVGTPSPMVMDSIVYLKNAKGDQPSVTINSGATSTSDRLVTLALVHGFKSIPADEISMQIANRPDLLDPNKAVSYSPSLAGWDLCDGLGSICANGARTVYVKYCARGECTIVVLDDILLESPWPDWGILINNDAVSTDTNFVNLKLNPWFNKPGTEVRLSNTSDFSAISTSSFIETIPWNLCFGLPNCVPMSYTVYVRYINATQDSGWPSTQSPKYEDDILLGATPTPTPPPRAAGIYINDGAVRTTSRVVGLTFSSPFGSGPGVTMRPINDSHLSPRDQDIIGGRNGGVDSQPLSAAQSVAQVGTQNLTERALSQTARIGMPELDSGTIRAFKEKLSGWDLCEGATDCPYGTYKVFVQYYKATGVAMISTTLAALGDEVSDIYYDTIVYEAPTPTPSVTVSPSPSSTVSPTPTTTPGILPGWIPGGVASLSEALTGSQGIIGQISVASSVAVAASAALAVFPLLSASGAFASLWQGFMAALGLLPKRKKVWGTVYDANTKRPIPFAKVQLLDRNKRVLETHIADKDGRYGFLTTPESLLAQNVQILILPIAKDYAFPAHTAATVDTFVYNNLYYGDLITMSDQTLINFDIPMDPLKPSVAPLLLKSPSIVLGASVAAIADAGFWLGLVMIPLNAILMPSPFTYGVLFLFLGTASLRIWGVKEHPFGTVSDSATGRPIPFALITLNDLSGKRVGFTVTDEQGRYFLVAEKGNYEMTIFTPATIVPARQTKQMIEARKGWITRGLKL